MGATLLLLIASFTAAALADVVWGLDLFQMHVVSNTTDRVVYRTPLRGAHIAWLLVLLTFGAILTLRTVRSLALKAHRAKRLPPALAASAIVVGFLAGAYLINREASIGNRLVIDTGGKVVLVDEEYLLRRTSYRVPFEAITQVEYHYFNSNGEGDAGEVRLLLQSGQTLTISNGSTTTNYALATTLEHRTTKPLLCWAHPWDSAEPHRDDCSV